MNTNMSKDEKKQVIKDALYERKFEKGCDYTRAKNIKAVIGDIHIANALSDLIEDGTLEIHTEKGNGNLYRIALDADDRQEVA